MVLALKIAVRYYWRKMLLLVRLVNAQNQTMVMPFKVWRFFEQAKVKTVHATFFFFFFHPSLPPLAARVFLYAQVR